MLVLRKSDPASSPSRLNVTPVADILEYFTLLYLYLLHTLSLFFKLLSSNRFRTIE